MFKRCRICGEPIVFLVLIGWVHVALTEDGHDAKEAR